MSSMPGEARASTGRASARSKSCCPHEREHLVAVRRFAGDLDVGRGGEDPLQPVADERVVVGEEDPDHAAGPSAARTQRHAHRDARAAARRARHFDRAAEIGTRSRMPFSPSERVLASASAGMPRPSSSTSSRTRAVLDREQDPRVLRAGVPRDVGERFLQRAIDGGRDVPLDAVEASSPAGLSSSHAHARNAARSPRPASPRRRQGRGRRASAGADRRRCAAPRPPSGRAPRSSVAALAGDLALGNPLAQPGEVHLQRGEELAELVVQLARDARSSRPRAPRACAPRARAAPPAGASARPRPACAA